MPFSGEWTILVPVDISETETPDLGTIEFLGPTRVVVLGYYPVPDQAEQARIVDQSESEATARLTEIVALFDGLDSEIEDVLEFTHDYHETIDRLAEQHDCEAVFTPGEDGPVERVLVPLRGGTNVERILTLVESVLQGTDVRVTLFHAVDSDADTSQGEFFIRGAADWLADEGIDRDRIDWQLSDGSDPKTVIADLAEVYDLIVLGETEPTLRERILGEVPIRIIGAIDKPTLVVRGVA